MEIEIKNSLPAIDESILTAFEMSHQVKLPDDYRMFLLAHNGGEPSPDVFAFGRMDEVTIRYFLGIAEGISEIQPNLDMYIKEYCEDARVPNNLLPIAVELSVDLICMSVAGDDYGKIYLWDHNFENPDNPDYSNLHLLANNFSDFLGILYEDVDS